MKAEDFKGMFKYKLIMPAVYIFFWFCLIFGPFFFDQTFQTICIVGMTYAGLKSVINLINICLSNLKFRQILNKKQSGAFEYQKSHSLNPIYHALIFPCYKEEVELIRMTLDFFAKHQKAKTQYLVFLAMQSRQQGSSQKAEMMIEQFKNQFRNITYTSHVLENGEPKLKCTNMTWCAKHMKETFEKLYIQKEEVIVTAMDADSWGPELYFEQIDHYIRQNLKNKDKVIFIPPQIFGRNSMEVSAWTAVFDTMHSIVHLANLPSLFFSLAISNYSMSYSFLQRVNYWDTNTLAEDTHMAFKASFKNEGDIITKVIYTPFNSLSIQTNQGDCADFKSKFWQFKRHALAVYEVAYLVKMMFNSPFRWINLLMTLFMFETFLHAPMNLCCVFGLLIRYFLFPLFGYTQGLNYSFFYVNILLNCGTILVYLCYLVYENMKRKANSELFDIPNQPLQKIWRFFVFFPFILVIMVAPSFHYATFEVAFCDAMQWGDNFKTVNNQESIQQQQQSELMNSVQQA